MSRELNCRPSDLLGLTNDWDRYCLDRAVVTFSMALEKAMNEAGANSKSDGMKRMWREQVLMRWLDVPAEQRFRSPMSKAK